MVVLLGIVTCWVLVSPALAADGDIDPAFSHDGFQATSQLQEDLGVADVSPHVAMQGSRVLVADSKTVVRLTASGQRDQSFAHRGILRATSRHQVVFDIAVDGAGRILLLLGQGDPVPSRYVVARFRRDGRRDHTFGRGRGWVSPPFMPADLGGAALGVAADGSTFIAGGANQVAKLSPEGDLASDFGQEGLATIEGASSLRTLTIGRGGEVYVGGIPSVYRLTRDGGVDPEFAPPSASDLCCELGSGSSFVVVSDVHVTPDGAVLFRISACSTSVAYQCKGRLVRTDAHGAVDPSFHSPSLVSTSQVSGSVVSDRDQAIVLSYAAPPFASLANVGVLQRLTKVGTRDRSFGDSGVAYVFPRGCPTTLLDVAIDARGRSVVAGVVCREIGVVRFRSGGRKPDRDGDGNVDAGDRCPFFFGTHSGCSVIGTRVRLVSSSRRRVVGEVRSRLRRCNGNREVELLSPRGNVVSRETTNGRGRFVFEGPVATDSVLRVSGGRASSIERFGSPGLCSPSRTDVVRGER